MAFARKPIRVLVTDDSAVYRTMISGNLAKKDGIEVVGTAYDAEDALRKIASLKPDVLSLDVEMPKMNGIELTKHLMSTESVLPIILVSAANINVFDALNAGAVDFVKKPDGTTKPEAFIDELASKIRIASVAKVAKHTTFRPTTPPSAAATAAARATGPSAAVSAASAAAKAAATKLGATAPPKHTPSISDISAPRSCSARACESTIIALGASTGGTESTLEVLQKLPANIPPILIVQHMPVGFTKLYAERLNRICAMNVKEAQDGDEVVPGTVYIAPGDVQMKLTKVGGTYKLQCRGTEKVSGHCPSVDVLFRSVAEVSTKKNVGIILTGMGRDGAEGLLEMKKRGAYTLGENEESCVVYGMPMVAQNIGAVMVQATNRDIPNLLMKHLNSLG